MSTAQAFKPERLYLPYGVRQSKTQSGEIYPLKSEMEIESDSFHGYLVKG